MSNGNGGGNGGGGIGGIFGALGAFLASLIQDIINALIFLANIIVAVFTFLLNLIKSLFDFSTEGDLGFLDTLHKIWIWVLTKLITPIIAAVKTVITWLQRVLKPVLKYLKMVQQWYNDYYKRVLKPLLTIITRLRQVLAFFKLFHLKWAATLDTFLSHISSQITRKYNEARGYLNYTLTWVLAFYDPRYLMRRVPFFASGMRAVNALSFIFTGHGIGYFSNVPGGPGLDSLGVQTATQHYTQLTTDLTGNSGDVTSWRQGFTTSIGSVQGEIGQGGVSS